MPNIDIRIQWHSPDQVYAAVLVRDGQEWYLDGALVGMASAPWDAVHALMEQAQVLVLQGENFLTDGPISLEDRIWLFKLLDQGSVHNVNEQMYAAIRTANGGKDPYR
jgi:hypothetical protein